MSVESGPSMSAVGASAEIGASPSMGAEFGHASISTGIDISSPVHPYSGGINISNSLEPKPSPGLIDVSSFANSPSAFDSLSDNKSIFSNAQTESLIDLSRPASPNLGNLTSAFETNEAINPDVEIPDVFYEAFAEKPARAEIPSLFQDTFADEQTIQDSIPDVYYEAFEDSPATAETKNIQMKETLPVLDHEQIALTEAEASSILESYLTQTDKIQDPDIKTQTATQVLDEIKTSEPNAYLEIIQEIAISGRVSEILADLDSSPDLAAQITGSVLTASLENKGLTQTVENVQAAISPEDEQGLTQALQPDAEANEDAEPNTALQMQKKAKEPETDIPPEEDDQYVRDEETNSTRKAEVRKAIQTVYQDRDSDVPIEGKEIVAWLNPDPSIDEVSEIARGSDSINNMRKDGTNPEIRDSIVKLQITSETDAIEKTERIHDEVTAVKKSSSGTKVDERAVMRVRESRKMKERIIYQAAA